MLKSLKKFHIFQGDISLRKFGLEDVDFLALTYDIDAVIHCAAQVNLLLPYSALYNANVIGTQTVVAFCLEGKLKPLHYIRYLFNFPPTSFTPNFSKAFHPIRITARAMFSRKT